MPMHKIHSLFPVHQEQDTQLQAVKSELERRKSSVILRRRADSYCSIPPFAWERWRLKWPSPEIRQIHRFLA